MKTLIGLLCIAAAYGLEVGTQKVNFLPTLPSAFSGVQEATKVTLDANWRWLHEKNSYSNCFTGDWVGAYCPDPITCSSNCALEGVEAAEYAATYGISVAGNALTLKYVTNGQYGVNVGARTYLVDAAGQNYRIFKLMNRQFSFTVDVSRLPCGLNGALYFVEMAADGGKSALNKPGAPYGTGYGDAQCPTDIKYINGFANINKTGACSNEMDIWEANSMATAYTPHVCSVSGVLACTDPKTCGTGPNRYAGVCDQDGADYNSYRAGDLTFYGPGTNYKINTLLPFTVFTQFITSNGQDTGDLIAIRRYYSQGGKNIEGFTMTDSTIATQKAKFSENNYFGTLGGLKAMGKSLSRGLTLVMSLWDDISVQMLWLDSTYPTGSSLPGALRGPCSAATSDVNYLRSTYPNSQVIYSDIQLSAISGSAPPTPSPAPPTPSPVPSTCSGAYSQCGGTNWNGPKCCSVAWKCAAMGDCYSQCIPDPTAKIFKCTGCVQGSKWQCDQCEPM